MAAVGPVADELQALLGRPVEILPLTSYDAMIDAQVQRRIDGGFYLGRRFRRRRCALRLPRAARRAEGVGRDARLSCGDRGARRLRHRFARRPRGQDRRDRRRAIRSARAACSSPGCLSEGIDPAATFGAVARGRIGGSGGQARRRRASPMRPSPGARSPAASDAGYSRGTLTDLVAIGRRSSMDQLVDRLALAADRRMARSR